MVRVSETYGYPSVKAMQHRKRERPTKVGKLEKACRAGFSLYARQNEISVWVHAATVIQSMGRFSRCKVAA